MCISNFNQQNLCILNDSINVTKEMVDVRDEFKECQGFSRGGRIHRNVVH